MVAALVAMPLLGGGIEFETRVDGQRLAGSTVCFFPAAKEDAFFPGSNDVRCLDADARIEMPPGHSAASLDFSDVELGPSEFAAVFLPNDTVSTSLAAVRPIAGGVNEIMVPAEMTVVPMIVRSAPIRAKAGARVKVPRMIATADVVALLTATDETKTVRGTPSVTLIADDEKREPMLPVPAYPRFSRSLIFYRDVPRGEARVQTTQASRALTAAPAAQLRVTWSITSTVAPEHLRAAPNCDGTVANDAGMLTILLDGKEIESVAIGGRSEATFASLPAGTYRVELRHGPARVEERVVAVEGETVAIHLPLDLRVIRGRVTRGGEPVVARVAFATGSGVSDANGRYAAVVARPPSTGTAQILPCDGSAAHTHRGSTPPPLDRDYDIELPDNEIVVIVRESGTNRPIARANVITRFFDEDLELDALPPSQTDAHGRVRLDDVSTREPLEICASTPRHEVACTPRFTMTSGRRDVTLTLTSKATRRGKVSGGSARVAHLYWVSAEGALLERTIVRPGGAFAFEHDPKPGEALVYVAADHPLTVVPVPPWSPDSEMNVALPRGMARSFDVHGTGERVQFTIAVGTVVVPRQAFFDYQLLRGSDNRVARGETIFVRDILLTAPIAVVYGSIKIPVNESAIEIP